MELNEMIDLLYNIHRAHRGFSEGVIYEDEKNLLEGDIESVTKVEPYSYYGIRFKVTFKKPINLEYFLRKHDRLNYYVSSFEDGSTICIARSDIFSPIMIIEKDTNTILFQEDAKEPVLYLIKQYLKHTKNDEQK